MSLAARFQQYLFRWRSDGTAPLRLGQRRIFIVPSRGGLLFAVALVVMLLGAINYNLALGHALVFLLAGLGVAGMIHTFRNLFGLVITPGRCEPVFAGQTAFFPLTLDNQRSAPRLALELAASAELPIEAAVASHGKTRVRVPLPTHQRGWLPLPRVRLSTRYPLGLFTAWAYLQPDMRCLVYPKPLVTPLPDWTNAAQADGNGLHGEEDFAGFRQRQPADSLRHVAWKASAHHGDEQHLLVKQFAGGASTELHLAWNLTDPSLDIESRLSQLTGWVLAAESSRQEYALDLPGQHIASGCGPAHCQQCLEALALYAP